MIDEPNLREIHKRYLRGWYSIIISIRPSSTDNVDVVRLNIFTQVRTRDLTVVCEF
jgi:hypothetical protein